jgi:hypothetical protein
VCPPETVQRITSLPTCNNAVLLFDTGRWPLLFYTSWAAQGTVCLARFFWSHAEFVVAQV